MALSSSTIISHSTSSILKFIKSSLPSGGPTACSVLYTLSPAASLLPAQLSHLVSHLVSIPNSIGCLCTPLPISVGNGPQNVYDATTCSLAVFDSSKAKIFRSTIPGKELPQVGRWHAFRNPTRNLDAEVGQEASYDVPRGWTLSAQPPALPDEIQELSSKDVNTVIYLSDGAPEGLADSLTRFRHATKLGLIASSTPFVTGRPFTLFHNSNILSDGAVGICLASRSSPLPRPRTRISFPGLKALTGTHVITSQEGNLVNSIDNSNPSRLLLNAIQKHNISLRGGTIPLLKQDHFYLGVLSGDNLVQVHHITSGDPSRGSIALDSEAAPLEGATVQIYYMSSDSSSAEKSPRALDVLTSAHGPSLNFCTLHSEQQVVPPIFIRADEDVVSSEDGDGSVILKNTFIAASENGCIVSRSEKDAKDERPWKADVPHGVITLDWPMVV